MADEELGGQQVAEAEGVQAAAAEGQEQVAEQQQTEADPIETLAREMGWRPKDEFRGDEADWREAKDFILQGREVQRSLSRELRGVRDEVTRISRTSATLMADKIAERDAYWAGQHRQAVKDGDTAAAERAVEERAKLKDAAPAPANTPPPETAAFMERHRAWFGEPTADGRFTGGDPLARMRAMEIANSLAAQGVDKVEQLRQAERAIRKEFPEHFPAAAKAPPGTQTAAARNAGGGSKKKGFADMPAESQKLAQEYKERHGIPLEKFAESYWLTEERKVR